MAINLRDKACHLFQNLTTRSTWTSALIKVRTFDTDMYWKAQYIILLYTFKCCWQKVRGLLLILNVCPIPIHWERTENFYLFPKDLLISLVFYSIYTFFYATRFSSKCHFQMECDIIRKRRQKGATTILSQCISTYLFGIKLSCCNLSVFYKLWLYNTTTTLIIQQVNIALRS